MTPKQKTVIIEQLNFFTAIFFFIFLKPGHSTARYIHTSRLFDLLCAKLQFFCVHAEKHFIRVNYSEFPGSYCEIKKETGLHANDALFEKYRSNSFVRPALNFCGDPRYVLALKKELYNRYTHSRVKTFVFLKNIALPTDYVVFLPVDRENIQNLLSDESQFLPVLILPRSYAFFLDCGGVLRTLGSLVAFPITVCLLAGTFFLRGVTIRPITKKSYSYALDSYPHGVDWNRPYHEFFLYNKSDFHPTKILHVFRSTLTDAKTRDLFQRYYYPSAVWENQKVPARFFLGRILGGMFLTQMAFFCCSMLTGNRRSFFLMPCLATMKMTVEAEIFYAHHHIDVFISRDEFSPLHIIRTIVAQKNQCCSVGFMHGDYTIPGTETSVYLLFDAYGIYGTFYRNFNSPAFELTEPDIIGAGIYGLDKTFSLARKNYVPNIYETIKKTHKILLIVGTYSGNETESCFTKTLLKKYYTEALTATDEFSDYYRIIKPASDELSDEELDDIVRGHDRVIVDRGLWMYKLILASDLTLVIGSTTVGLESLMAGKKVLYYDVYHYPENVYARYSDLLVAFDYATFLRNIRSVIVEDRYLDQETLELIRSKHGYLFDGRVVARFRNLCRSLIRSKG